MQKAVDFFKQAGLSRLVEKLREKYIELGRVGGQIVLEDSTMSERQAVASFLGKPLSSDINLKVRVADVEKAAMHSFACSLPALLNAYFSDRPLVTRQEQRATRTARQDAFHQQLASIAEQLPAGSRGRHWLLHGQHGLEWLFTRYKNESTHEQARQVELVRYIAQTFDQLPQPGMPERLALFAQRTSGDPHMLDADRAAGRLFLYALTDLANNAGPTIKEYPTINRGYSLQTDREQILRLYSDVGLLVDTISSNVAIFNLAGAVYHDGTSDALVQAAGERVLLLPLRQLLEWQSVVPAQRDVYVFENPQVFEEVIVGLSSRYSENELPGRGQVNSMVEEWPHTAPGRGQASPLPYNDDAHSPQPKHCPGQSIALHHLPYNDDAHSPQPTLVCTSGWPSTAAIKLLQMLVDQSPDNRLYYSGDFDLKGLQIAASLMARYAGRCYPWCFDAESYVVALQAGGVAASAVELNSLSALPEVFASLVTVMQEKGLWAYQEGIVRLLTEDVKARPAQPPM